MSRGPWKRKAPAKGLVLAPLTHPDRAGQYAANHKRKHPDHTLLLEEWCSWINSTNAPELAASLGRWMDKNGLQIQEKQR